jgi:hypothetical protein
VVAVDLGWPLSVDSVQCIGPEFQRGAFFSVIFVAIINAVGDAPFALSAIVQDPLG